MHAVQDEVEVAKAPFERPGDGVVFKDDKGVWHAWWRDHANRIIKFKLGAFAFERWAKIAAFEAVERYQADVEIRNKVREMLDPEELRDMAERAALPREVVAKFIRELCQRIAREESIEVDGDKTPAIELFVDRLKNDGGKGISAREVHRILKEHDRITVSIGVVDEICCEFPIAMSDVVESALDWSRLDGEWAGRAGTEDPWPYGYPLSKGSEEDDLL